MKLLPNFQKMKTSLLLEVFKTETQEPQNVAVDGWSKELVRWHKVNEYGCDIDRILKELFLAVSLIKSIPSQDFLSEHGISVEDYILYHQGNTLTLTHQLKDKIGQLCKNIFIKPFNEDNIRILSLANREEMIAIPGLSEKLKIWSDESHSRIGRALRKRTLYHHRRNKNANHIDLQRYKAFRSIRDIPSGSIGFNIEKISQAESDFFKKWKIDIEKESDELLSEIIENIEGISEILYSHGKTARAEEAAAIIVAYQEMMRSLEIENVGSKDKIQEDFLPLVELFEKEYPMIFENSLESIYLIGSVARGEAAPLLSDLNVVIVLENEELTASVRQGLGEMLEKIPLLKKLLDLQIVHKGEFLSDRKKKLRFICKSESVLLYGKDIIDSEEKFPKAGLELSHLLNSDFRELIADTNSVIIRGGASQNEINFLTSRLTRAYLRILFSGLMAERGGYERNLKKIIRLLTERFPENKNQIAILDILSNRHLDKDLDTLKILVEGGIKNGGTYENILTQIETSYAQLDKREKYK